MNKKITKLATLTLAFSIFSFLTYKVIKKIQEKNIISNSIKTIPEFSYTTLNKIEFTNNNLKFNLPVIFLYFHSECILCQYEAESISESIDKFNYIQLIFVSTEPIEKIEAFSEHYNLNNKENIIFLNDAKDTFSKLFKATSIPFTLIYNEEQQLIKMHRGQLNAVGILRIINEKK